jgi:hypothetical protein
MNYFRNIGKRKSYQSLRVRKTARKKEDWQDIYKNKFDKAMFHAAKYAVENQTAIIIAIITALASIAGGFYLGQKYSQVNVAKDVAEEVRKFIPKEVLDNLPKSIRKYI